MDNALFYVDSHLQLCDIFMIITINYEQQHVIISQSSMIYQLINIENDKLVVLISTAYLLYMLQVFLIGAVGLLFLQIFYNKKCHKCILLLDI